MKDEASKRLFEALKNDPQAILNWIDEEIEEYKKLKKLIIEKMKKK